MNYKIREGANKTQQKKISLNPEYDSTGNRVFLVRVI